MSMVNSMIVDNDDVSESVVDGLIDEMGKLPTKYFDVQIVVTVIATPLPDPKESFVYKLWGCFG